MAIHQNHDYRHIVDLESKPATGAVSVFGNRLLVKSILMTLEDADWQVDESGLPHLHQDPLAPLNEAALKGEIHEYPADAQAARMDRAQQWDRVEETLCGAALGAT